MIKLNRFLLISGVFSSFLFFACGGTSAPVEPDNPTVDWGYSSLYKGYTRQAATWDNAEREEIAAVLVPAIRYGINIYNKAVNVIIPELFDDYSSYKTEEGDCNLLSKGERKYYTRDKNSQEAYSLVDYFNFCVKNGTSTVEPATIVNSIVDSQNKLNETKTTNLSQTSYNYKFVTLGLGVFIKKDLNAWDNYSSIRGIIERTKNVNNSNGKLTGQQMRIGLDMPYGFMVTRFDLSISTVGYPTKTINFYYPDYGYVNVDISFLVDGQQLADGDTLVMKFRDSKDCIFKPSEIGTRDFDCNRK